MAATGCGHYPAPSSSAHSIKWASSSEHLIAIRGLPLEDWPKLEKFKKLSDLRVDKVFAPQITDEHLKLLSHLKLPELGQVDLGYCSNVTDAGLRSLAAIPSIRSLNLFGTSITDRGMITIATGFQNLNMVCVGECRLLTTGGFLNLTNSTTITQVALSFDPFSQAQLEHIISTLANVRWWIIGDPGHDLDLARLRRLGESRKITIEVIDDRDLAKVISLAPRVGPSTRTIPAR